MIATKESIVPHMTIITWLLDSVGKRYDSTAVPIMVIKGLETRDRRTSVVVKF